MGQSYSLAKLRICLDNQFGHRNLATMYYRWESDSVKAVAIHFRYNFAKTTKLTISDLRQVSVIATFHWSNYKTTNHTAEEIYL